MKIAKVRDVKTPERGTGKSAGIDFFIPNDFKETVLLSHTDILIPSGIKVKVPKGYMLRADNKSGVATSYSAAAKAGRTPKKNAFVSPLIIGACVVDEDYQGEIHLHIINVGQSEVILKPGMKIAQFILVPVLYSAIELVDENELFRGDYSERGDGGFGSTDHFEADASTNY